MSLTELRKKAGLTREKAANALGISVSCLQKWEAYICAPRSNRLDRMAQLYGVTVNEIILSSKLAKENY